MHIMDIKVFVAPTSHFVIDFLRYFNQMLTQYLEMGTIISFRILSSTASQILSNFILLYYVKDNTNIV